MCDYELKILSNFFESVLSGEKTFEIRNNKDREFQTGDIYLLKEVAMKVPHVFTGRTQKIQILYITNFNQPKNQVVFSFKKLK